MRTSYPGSFKRPIYGTKVVVAVTTICLVHVF